MTDKIKPATDELLDSLRSVVETNRHLSSIPEDAEENCCSPHDYLCHQIGRAISRIESQQAEIERLRGLCDDARDFIGKQIGSDDGDRLYDTLPKRPQKGESQ